VLNRATRPIRQAVKAVVRLAGFEIIPRQPLQVSVGRPDITHDDAKILAAVQPYTMTSPERILALIDAVRYVTAHSIPGAVVECGVWRGGSSMAAALALQGSGVLDRELYLFDTFAGMTTPTQHDRSHDGLAAEGLLLRDAKGTGIWCEAGLGEVSGNLQATGYPTDKLRLVQGKVEDTIPATMPERIAVLRLDTDWYESTRHELVHLVPRLQPGGFLIVDDYGHWQGARKAVDEYFAGLARPPFLHRIDYTGRIAQFV
jgi:O-methyltransferase